jgi:hypothetical protein
MALIRDVVYVRVAYSPFFSMGNHEPQRSLSSFPSSAQCLIDWDLYKDVFLVVLVFIYKEN